MIKEVVFIADMVTFVVHHMMGCSCCWCMHVRFQDTLDQLLGDQMDTWFVFEIHSTSSKAAKMVIIWMCVNTMGVVVCGVCACMFVFEIRSVLGQEGG